MATGLTDLRFGFGPGGGGGGGATSCPGFGGFEAIVGGEQK